MNTSLTLVTAPAAEPVTIADVKIHSKIDTSFEDSEIAGYITAARQLGEEITRRAFMPQTWRRDLEHWPGRSYVNGMRDVSNLAQYYRWNHIEIPKPPLVSIVSFTYRDTLGNDSSMTQGYGSQSGNYLLDIDSEPGRIVLPYSGIWPTTVLLPSLPIRITYTCGYSAYSGVVSVDENGVVTWVSGTQFTAALAGSWINIAGNSYNVRTYTDATHLQLVLSSTITPITNGAYTANEVPMAIRQAILMTVAHFIENREGVQVARSAQAAIELPFGINNLLAPYRVWKS